MDQSKSAQAIDIRELKTIHLTLFSSISPPINFEINQLDKIKDDYVLTIFNEAPRRIDDPTVRSLEDTVHYIIQDHRLMALNHFEKESPYSALAQNLNTMKSFNPFTFEYSINQVINSFPFNSKDYLNCAEEITSAIIGGDSKIVFSIEVEEEILKKEFPVSEVNSKYIAWDILNNELKAIKTNPKQIEIFASKYFE